MNGEDMAYERGREDMRKELLGDGKAQGWCAERPISKEAIYNLSPTEAGMYWFVFNHDRSLDLEGWRFQLDPDSESAQKMTRERVIKAGWIIKPVRLVEVKE